MGIEENQQLHFLGVIVQKREDSNLGHIIYRKKTHANRYLNSIEDHQPSKLPTILNILVDDHRDEHSP